MFERNGPCNHGKTGGGGVGALNGVNTGFIMNGGTISGNDAPWGGGVAIYQGSFIMIGGSITSNEARNYGGGVGICLPNAGGPTDPSFAKTGGLITAKNETAPNRPDLELEFDGNSVIGEDGKKKTDKGHAVYYNPDGLYREAMDASPALIMNSEEAGGWDNWPSPLP